MGTERVVLVSLWDPTTEDYMTQVIEWLDSTGKTEFYHSELPEHLQSRNARLLQKARDKGYVKKLRNVRSAGIWVLRRRVQ